MTILPELRDALARSRPPVILPELRDGLAGTGLRQPAPRRRRRRPLVVGSIALGGMLVSAGALAATGVLPIGSPVVPHHVERNPAHGIGTPVDASARLLPLRVADPDGGPPWGLRMVTSSRGLGCLQLGRIVGEEFGVLGQDGVAGNDGRFHPLPLATASGPLTCIQPDGAGRFFTGVDRSTYASGDATERSCRPVDESDKKKGKRCPIPDQRKVSYGLLGPEAKTVTFSDGTKIELTAPDGAYLFVERGTKDDTVISMGGGPGVNGIFGAGVERIDYRDGTFCPTAAQAKRPFCLPKGYVERSGTKDATSMRRPLRIGTGTRRFGKAGRVPELRVSFVVPKTITDGQHMYLLLGRFPDSDVENCRHTVFYVPTQKNLKAGVHAHLDAVVPPECTGHLEASVLYADISYHNGEPPAATVGRISRSFP